MRYMALALDFDGTIAHDGLVAPSTIDALRQFAATGRKLLLVTGRELDELLSIFPDITLFDRVVAENGALLYRPATGERAPLGDPPPQAFVQELLRRDVHPLSVGASIVATVHPNETIVLAVIRDLGLELHVIFNKGAVMVLPGNVNKGSGLVTALTELGLSVRNVVAIGDAENDHSMFDLSEYAVAVANALPMVKEHADRVTAQSHGAGVVEVVLDLVEHDLVRTPPRSMRRSLALGERQDGAAVALTPAGINLLVTGSPGSGKAAFASGVLARLGAQGYQFCVVDPEGGYDSLADVVVLGDKAHAPGASEVLTALEQSRASVVVNMLSVPLQDRQTCFCTLLGQIQELRTRTGRPHWMLLDHAHRILPRDWEPARWLREPVLSAMIYVTAHPDRLSPAVLHDVNVVVARGEKPAQAIEQFCSAAGIAMPDPIAASLEQDEALAWLRDTDEAPFRLRVLPSAARPGGKQDKGTEGMRRASERS